MALLAKSTESDKGVIMDEFELLRQKFGMKSSSMSVVSDCLEKNNTCGFCEIEQCHSDL
jgi:hypothetical protein